MVEKMDTWSVKSWVVKKAERKVEKMVDETADLLVNMKVLRSAATSVDWMAEKLVA